LHIDRASWASQLGPQRSAELASFGQAWPVRPGPYFPKSAFHLDGERPTLWCPGGAVMPLAPGGVVQFPAASCAGWVWRERCTASASGRSVSLHPDEALVQEWRERQQTPQGRAQGRERAPVTVASGRMCWICGAVLSCIIGMC